MKHSPTVIILSVFAIAAIVMAAIAVDALLVLIGGLVVVGAVLIGLASIGVNLFAKATEADNKRKALLFDHVETMAKIGYLPESNNVRYIPLQLQEQSDIPVSTSGQTASTLDPYRDDALNLAALSKQEMGEDATQLIPYHRARRNDYFRDVAIWMRAVQYLLVNQMAEERYQGSRKMGTFVKSGTVGQLWQRLYRPTA